MGSRFFRIPLEQIAYVRGVLDGYDGLVVMRALPGRGEVEWLLGGGLDAEVDEVAGRLAREAGLCEIAPPPDWPPL